MSERKGLTYEEIKAKKPVKKGISVGMEGENYIVALDENIAYTLTAGAFYVWSVCNGEKTVEELVNKLSEELSVDEETAMSVDELKEPVTVIIGQLLEAGLITFGE